MSRHQGDPYIKCNGCGVRDDDPVIVARIKRSENNAFIAVSVTNVITGEESECDYCSECWCRMLAAAQGRAVPPRGASPFPHPLPSGDAAEVQLTGRDQCTCDVPVLRGACQVHPTTPSWHPEMS